MDRKIGLKWCAELRSGKYKKGTRNLCKVKGKTSKYCCLGVLCAMLNTPYQKTYGGRKAYGTHLPLTNSLPTEVLKKTKMFSGFGRKSDQSDFKNSVFYTLSSINDETDLSFKQIADIIEENIDNL